MRITNKIKLRIQNSFLKGAAQGTGIAFALFATTLFGVAVTGTIKTWTSGEPLTASDLNTTITSLRTAIEGIPDWTKDGTSARFSNGSVRILPGAGGANWLEFIHAADANLSWGLNDGFTNRNFVLYRYDNTSTHLDSAWEVSNANGNTTFYHNVAVVGSVSKGSGTFDIPHPDPTMPQDSHLRHSFVESPTAGDNIYRWQVRIERENGMSYIQLPKYWNHLNENPMVWVSSAEEPALSYGYVKEDKIIVQANKVGTYNVLLIGTRKDQVAVSHWKELGMEYIANGIGSAKKILSYKNKEESGVYSPKDETKLSLKKNLGNF